VEAGGALSLRAVVIDQVGHSALEVKMERRETMPMIASVHFYLACNPADLNRLGAALAAWATEPSRALDFEW
jgi:hypothetical protein